MIRSKFFLLLSLAGFSAFAEKVYFDTLYRFRNHQGWHMMSTNPNEGSDRGYTQEGPVCRILREPFFGATSKLYSCRVPQKGQEFLSVDPRCEGFQTVRFLGYTFPAEVYGTRGLTRCLHTGSGDHISVIDTNECHIAGYKVEGPQGFVPVY